MLVGIEKGNYLYGFPLNKPDMAHLTMTFQSYGKCPLVDIDFRCSDFSIIKEDTCSYIVILVFLIYIYTRETPHTQHGILGFQWLSKYETTYSNGRTNLQYPRDPRLLEQDFFCHTSIKYEKVALPYLYAYIRIYFKQSFSGRNI